MGAPCPLPVVAGSKEAARLRRDGYCIMRGALPAAQIEALHRELAERFERTPFSNGPFSGASTKRFHGLLKRSRGAAALVSHSEIIAVAEAILLRFADTIQLNLTQAIEVHPGAPGQIPHRDQDMWQGEKGRSEYLLNVMWPLTPFRPENGGTLLWPSSHLRQDVRLFPPEQAISPRLVPGDALMFLGSTLHAGGGNHTTSPRRGIIVSYCLGWLKPYENMWLTYPPDVARDFSPELRALIGYRRNRPNLGNYDGQCPSILFDRDVPDYLAASDDLTPQQREAIVDYIAAQSASAVPLDG